MAALAIGLGGAIGELWVQDGLLLLLALGLSSFAGYRLYIKNNSEKKLQDAIFADERAIDLACRFGYSIPNAYKSLGGALKELIEKLSQSSKSIWISTSARPISSSDIRGGSIAAAASTNTQLSFSGGNKLLSR